MKKRLQKLTSTNAKIPRTIGRYPENVHLQQIINHGMLVFVVEIAFLPPFAQIVWYIFVWVVELE